MCRPQSQRDGVSQSISCVCTLCEIPIAGEEDINLDARPHLMGNLCWVIINSLVDTGAAVSYLCRYQTIRLWSLFLFSLVNTNKILTVTCKGNLNFQLSRGRQTLSIFRIRGQDIYRNSVYWPCLWSPGGRLKEGYDLLMKASHLRTLLAWSVSMARICMVSSTRSSKP